MLEMIKIAGLSAVLSAGFVTAYNPSKLPETAPVSGKIYVDRILESDDRPMTSRITSTATPRVQEAAAGSANQASKGDQLRTAGLGESCRAQAWPNIARECLVAAEGTPVRNMVRTITVETRESANTSVLVRLPSGDVAQR